MKPAQLRYTSHDGSDIVYIVTIMHNIVYVHLN
jgi:hypothetical protein